MPAWNAISKFQQTEGYTVTVGPSIFEAQPSLKWSTVSDDFEWPTGETAMVFLGAIPPPQHDRVIQRLLNDKRGIILASKEDVSEEVWTELHDTLEALPFNYEDEAATYGVDWWQDGNKKLYASPSQLLVGFRLHAAGDNTMPQPRSVPVVPLRESGISSDLQVYLDATPSGPFQA